MFVYVFIEERRNAATFLQLQWRYGASQKSVLTHGKEAETPLIFKNKDFKKLLYRFEFGLLIYRHDTYCMYDILKVEKGLIQG